MSFQNNTMDLKLFSSGFRKSHSRYQNVKPNSSNIKIFKSKNWRQHFFHQKIIENQFWLLRSEWNWVGQLESHSPSTQNLHKNWIFWFLFKIWFLWWWRWSKFFYHLRYEDQKPDVRRLCILTCSACTLGRHRNILSGDTFLIKDSHSHTGQGKCKIVKRFVFLLALVPPKVLRMTTTAVSASVCV